MSDDPVLNRLLLNNAQWAEDVAKAEPSFFKRSAEGQSPKVLWIGCGDSRVPETVITACKPGEIFTHRNIANQFHPEDESALSVLAYAVDVVGVQHVIIVGHTNCGGAAACHAAAKNPPVAPSTPLERWLAPLTALARDLNTPDLTVLVEANVRAQVRNVVETKVLKEAWAAGKNVSVHGWVYELETGKLRSLVSVESS